MRKPFITFTVFVIALNVYFYFRLPQALWNLVLSGPFILLGIRDMLQPRHAIKRNFPVFGHFRYLFESIRPEINQYFVESNTDGRPFSREERSLVYQRSKKVLDTLPFGTQKDVYRTGHEFVAHSMVPTHLDEKELRVTIGGPECKKPYNASIFNISAMSYGSMSKNAILALNGGAKDGNFAHNTGEGSISPYHLEPGGDLIWQIGTGYFGCRDDDGNFNEEKFVSRATLDNVKMIEIKVSQGAKPGHGGILPKEKVTEEIAQIREVPMGIDIISPPAHKAFSTPIEFVHFIKKLRELSGGKPVGFKLCVGKRFEFLAVCKAMISENIFPDFITVDGSEGGTGAAPLEFSNNMGTPTYDGLVFVHNALKGFGVRDKIKILTTGRIVTGFGIVKLLALGADACYSARSMMLALGCIQALRCNSNHCPAGVATQDPELYVGLVPEKKRKRVANFHNETMKSVAHIMGAMGVSSPDELSPIHIKRRVSDHIIQNYSDFVIKVEDGDFLKGRLPELYKNSFYKAQENSFKMNQDYKSLQAG
jgi:glutamate synthase domain-containing protein 2